MSDRLRFAICASIPESSSIYSEEWVNVISSGNPTFSIVVKQKKVLLYLHQEKESTSAKHFYSNGLATFFDFALAD